MAWAVLSLRHAVEQRRVRAERAWNDTTQCVRGAPLEPSETLTFRVQHIRQALLNAPGVGAPLPWPKRCAETARAASQAALELPEHTRPQFELAAELGELANVIATGNEARFVDAISLSLQDGARLGFRQQVHAEAASAPAPARALFSAPSEWQGDFNYAEGMFSVALGSQRHFVLRGSELEQRQFEKLRSISTAEAVVFLAARTLDSDPMCYGVMDLEFAEIEGKFKFYCAEPVHSPALLDQHVELTGIALDHDTVSAALQRAPAALQLFEPDTRSAGLLHVAKDAFFSAGYLLYNERGALWGRHIDSNPRRLAAPVRLGSDHHLQTSGSSCLAVWSRAQPGMDELSYLLGGDWHHQPLSSFGLTARFHCDARRVVLLERGPSATLRRTECTTAGCLSQSGSMGELSAFSGPALAEFDDQIALLWRSKLGDVRLRVARLPDLARAPDHVLLDPIPGAGRCEIESGQMSPLYQAPGAWFVVPNCEHPGKRIFHLLSVDASGPHFQERPASLPFE